MTSETAPVFEPEYPHDGESYTPEGAEDFEHVAEMFGSDWEWDWIDFWYSPSKRRYFWYEQSGCSCYSPFTSANVTLGDFGDGSYADAMKVILDWESNFWDTPQESQRNKAISALQRHHATQRRKAAPSYEPSR